MLRRLKNVFFLAAVVSVSVLAFYMNVRHENNLSLGLSQNARVQDQLGADPRFKEVVVANDAADGVSTLKGTVAARADLDELMTLISKIPPFSGTAKWVVSVTVKE